MLIDWFTVIAQVLNFLILVWLLKRFLYKPILNAIDAREQRIADELANAKTLQTEAKAEHDKFVQSNAEFTAQREKLFKEATDNANTERERMLLDARKQADILSTKRQSALLTEEKSLLAEMRRLTLTEVFAIARKALTDLGGVDLEQRITEFFIARLQTIDSPVKDGFVKAIALDSKFQNDPMFVRSAFELPPEQRAAIQNALNTQFSASIELQFETAPEIIGGIELSVKGQKIAWSLSEYLDSLQKNVGDLLSAAALVSKTANPINKSPDTSKAGSKNSDIKNDANNNDSSKAVKI